jgi:hypothetical protein
MSTSDGHHHRGCTHKVDSHHLIDLLAKLLIYSFIETDDGSMIDSSLPVPVLLHGHGGRHYELVLRMFLTRRAVMLKSCLASKLLRFPILLSHSPPVITRVDNFLAFLPVRTHSA